MSRLMGRIRTVKPETFDDEYLGALPPLARWYFLGLWTQADRLGRLRYEPGRLKARLLSYDRDADVEALTAVLEQPKPSGEPFVRRYVVDGVTYLTIEKFGLHQCPNKREPASEIPAPPEKSSNDGDTHVHARAEKCTHEPARVEREREREREEERGEREDAPPPAPTKTTQRRRCRLPDDFVLSETMVTYATGKGIGPKRVHEVFAAFSDHHRAKGSVYLDWPAAWRTWVRREVEVYEPRRVRMTGGYQVRGESRTAVPDHVASKRAVERVAPRPPAAPVRTGELFAVPPAPATRKAPLAVATVQDDPETHRTRVLEQARAILQGGGS